MFSSMFQCRARVAFIFFSRVCVCFFFYFFYTRFHDDPTELHTIRFERVVFVSRWTFHSQTIHRAYALHVCAFVCMSIPCPIHVAVAYGRMNCCACSCFGCLFVQFIRFVDMLHIWSTRSHKLASGYGLYVSIFGRSEKEHALVDASS